MILAIIAISTGAVVGGSVILGVLYGVHDLPKRIPSHCGDSMWSHWEPYVFTPLVMAMCGFVGFALWSMSQTTPT